MTAGLVHDNLPTPPDGRNGWPWRLPAIGPQKPAAEPAPWPRISIVTPSYNQAPFLKAGEPASRRVRTKPPARLWPSVLAAGLINARCPDEFAMGCWWRFLSALTPGWHVARQFHTARA